jgi:hypothetical protein
MPEETRMRWSPSSFFPVVAALMTACAREPAPPAEPIPATPDVTVPAAAEPVSDSSVGAAVRAALSGDGDTRYFDARVDLNGDGQQEVVAYVAGPMVCGTGGCKVFVFTPTADGLRLVSDISVAQPPVRLSPRSSQGWRNLVVGIAGGGIPAGTAELEFDGKTYPSNPTVPPAKPAADLDGATILIPEFESYTQGKPVPQGIYGDPNTPVAGEVLGTAVHTQDAEELRYLVLQKLTNRYAQQNGIEVTQAEREDYVRHMKEALKDDPNFKDAPVEDSPEDAAARLEIAGAFIQQWKINRALYQHYGGRVIYQQGGPEPLDAYRKFLEESQAKGDFRIVNPALEPGFWRYYRDESIHSFYPPGSAEERTALATAPWESD